MAETASDHIAPCNTGTSEAHNRRSAEYMAQINKDNIYVRSDLTFQNEVWVADEIAGIDQHDGKVLQTVYNNLAALVKQKTGRKMQEKIREKVNPKTGKTVKVNGSSPIREGVVLMKDDTTMEDLKCYAEAVHQRFGITPLQIFIHCDEGHYEGKDEGKVWKPNYHAHIVWDWINHETGKSWKLNQADMRELQTIAAETLQMERGKSKSETGKEHLERNDFIIEKQKREAELAEIRLHEAESECEKLEDKVEQAKAEAMSLDTQISAKQNEVKQLNTALDAKKKAKEKADRENVNAILDKAASFFGKGELASKAKEIEVLKAENGALKTNAEKQKSEHDKELASMRKYYEGEVTKEVEKRVVPYKEELKNLKKTNAALCKVGDDLIAERDNFKERLHEYKHSYASLIKLLGKIMSQISHAFNAAIRAIINFANDGLSNKHRDIFTASEVADIKQTMDDFSPITDDRQLVGKILIDFAQAEGELNEQEMSRAKNEVTDVAAGLYDHIIERANAQGLSM